MPSSIARCPMSAAIATLFVYDDATNQFVRRSTNLKKENGDRAVGTQLAPDHPGQAVVRRGEAYKGPAVLFSKNFMTAYYPIVNSSAKVIGILYVGIPMAQFEGMLAQAIQTMAIAAGIAALLVLAADHAGGAPDHQAADLGHGLADGDCERQQSTSRSTRHERTTRSARSPAPSPYSRTTRRSASACAPSRLRRPRLPPSSARRNCAASSTSSRPGSAASSRRC